MDGRTTKYVAVDDCGPVVNPEIVDGEGTAITGTTVNHVIPDAPEIPNKIPDRTEIPSPTSPMGTKGTGATAAQPAAVNTVVDALSYERFTHVGMPASPFKVHQTTQDVRGRGSEAGNRDAVPPGCPPHSGGPGADVWP